MDFDAFLTNEKEKLNTRYLTNYFDSIIKEEEETEIQNYLQLVKRFLLKGGRRLHPISSIKVFQGIAPKHNVFEFSNDIYEVSLSAEMLHISSLVIDEMVDENEIKSGEKSLKNDIVEMLKKLDIKQVTDNSLQNVGKATSIYLSNIITQIGMQFIERSRFPTSQKQNAMSIYQKGICSVQRGRLLNEYYKLIPLEKITLENYLILAGFKRGSQYSTSMGIGAALGNARKTQMEPLMKAGNKIGIIEQLKNDLDGIEDDIKSGQATILTTIAYQSANKDQKSTLNELIGNKNINSNEIQEVKDIFKQTQAIDFVSHYANSVKNDAYNSFMDIYPGLRPSAMEFFENFLSYYF